MAMPSIVRFCFTLLVLLLCDSQHLHSLASPFLAAIKKKKKIGELPALVKKRILSDRWFPTEH